MSRRPHSDLCDCQQRRAFAACCDRVLVPALLHTQGARVTGPPDMRQWSGLRGAVARVLDRLDDLERIRAAAGRRANAPGDAFPAAPRLVLPCLGMGHPAEELATALLVRLLRAQDVDARHLRTRDDLDALPAYGVARSAVRTVCLVSLSTPDFREHGLDLAEEARWLLPHARVFGLLLAGQPTSPRPAAVTHLLDGVAGSFEEAVCRLAGGWEG
jgi:hypothetical protein